MTFRTLGILGIIIGSTALASDEPKLYKSGILEIQSTEFAVLVRSATEPVSRTYVLSKKNPGIFLVSVDDTSFSTSSTRSNFTQAYYIFPRSGSIEDRKLPNGDVELTTAQGGVIILSSKDGTIKTISGARHTQDPGIHFPRTKEQEDKVLFKLSAIHNGIVLDCGACRGGSALKPQGKTCAQSKTCTITDPNGKKCSVSNPGRMFETDSEFEKYLAKSCPSLDRSPLSVSKIKLDPNAAVKSGNPVSTGHQESQTKKKPTTSEGGSDADVEQSIEAIRNRVKARPAYK